MGMTPIECFLDSHRDRIFEQSSNPDGTLDVDKFDLLEEELIEEKFNLLWIENEEYINTLSSNIFVNNYSVGWWSDEDLKTLEKDEVYGKYTKSGATLISSKLALCHSELSESLEGMRKGLKDDHLPNREMFEVELADTLIRILDLAGACKLDIGGAVKEKLEYNQSRQDHKLKNRESNGGKTI